VTPVRDLIRSCERPKFSINHNSNSRANYGNWREVQNGLEHDSDITFLKNNLSHLERRGNLCYGFIDGDKSKMDGGIS
jgi:hypothetical protein